MNKIVIVVLVIIIAVFIFLTVWGSAVSEKPKRGGKDEAADLFKKKKSPGFAKVIKKLFGGLGKKTILPCAEQFKNQPGLECAALSLDKEININSGNGVSFRTVTFVLVKGRARVEYEDRTEKAEKFDLDEQEFDLPNFDTEDPKIGSIVALEDGGILTVSCVGNDPCQVGQE